MIKINKGVDMNDSDKLMDYSSLYMQNYGGPNQNG